MMVGSNRASIIFRCWAEKQNRSIRSAERGVLAWVRDDFQIKNPKRCDWVVEEKMLSLSVPKARLLLQLLIPLVTRSVVNDTAEVNDFPRRSVVSQL